MAANPVGYRIASGVLDLYTPPGGPTASATLIVQRVDGGTASGDKDRWLPGMHTGRLRIPLR